MYVMWVYECACACGRAGVWMLCGGICARSMSCPEAGARWLMKESAPRSKWNTADAQNAVCWRDVRNCGVCEG